MMWLAKSQSKGQDTLLHIDDLAVTSGKHGRSAIMISGIIKTQNIGMIRSRSAITLARRGEVTLDPRQLHWWSEDLGAGMTRVCGVLRKTDLGLSDTSPENPASGILVVAPQAESLVDVAWNQVLGATRCPLKPEWGSFLGPTISQHLVKIYPVESRWFHAAWLTISEQEIRNTVSEKLAKGEIKI